MRKLFFLSLLSAFVLTSCVTPKFGVRGGANFATITGDDTDNLDSRIGLFLGGTAEFEVVADKFAIQPELLYSMQGSEYSDSDGGFDGRFKLDYLNVPVMAKVYVADGFFLEAGPQIGFLLSAKD
ncbi:MAG: PorT family protein, partial [Eudoraea sp.]|nr:PorT family protein [Eudoraea sp.]